VQTGGDARFSRSVDGGKSLSNPVIIHSSPAGKAVVESRLALLSDGTLLDVFGEPPAQPMTAPQQTFATRSTDHGRTWSQPVRITTVGQDPILDPDTGKPQYDFCCLFGVAVAPNDHAYLAYTGVAGRKSGRVLVASSTNGGKTWRRPRTVASIHAQTLQPAIAVARDGTVGITWYDFRNDKPRDKALTTDYWFAYSRDGGKRWHEHHLGGPFDLRTSRRTGRPVGVYQGLAGLRHGFAATFIQAKPQAKHGSEDVFFARITPPPKKK
jgi:Neuraminidase (sialidase)